MSDVTPKIFRDDVMDSFNTYWTGAHSDVPISFPNLPFDPEGVGETETGAWVRLWIQGNVDDGQVRLSNSVASNHWRRSGKIAFEVYVREQSSTDLAYDLASDVSLWLENPGTTFGWFSNISAPVEVGPDGTWFQVSVSADWTYLSNRAA